MDKHLKIIPGGGQRMDFGHFVDRVFWAAFLGIALFVAKSVNELNERVAVVISQVGNHEKRIDKLEEFSRPNR